MAESSNRTPNRWSNVVLESVVIVLSILLAFAIEAGWDERQERVAETEILEALVVEFERYEDRFGRMADFYQQTADQIVWLLDEAEFSPSEAERLDEAMLAFVGAPTFDVSSGVHAELVASGRVSLLSDPSLRRRISTWQGLLNETTDNEIVVRQYLGSVMVPYLASRKAPIGRASRIPKGSEWHLSVTPDSEAISTYRDLVRDPEFRGLATWRYEWALGSTRSYRGAEAAADSVLSLVRANLGG